MKLQQLRYIREVARCQLNISQAADKLFTSQPGVSKQVRLLEEELGVEIFQRNGKHLQTITPAGQRIIEAAEDILTRVENIRKIAGEALDEEQGSLRIATTHTQSRYVLPAIIQQFMQRFPKVSLHLHQGSPMQISQLAADGSVDFAIATEALEHFKDLIMLPSFEWNRSILVPRGHPLAEESPLSLESINRFPLITYVFGFTGRSRLDEAFQQAGLVPNVVVTAADADVIKTYVRAGMGIGIIASMAWEAERDSDLIALDASHLFQPSTTHIGFRKGSYLRRYMIEFIQAFAPHLNPERIDQALQCPDNQSREALFASLPIPRK
jgi:LysR family cys regulon transcriptional activator